MVRNERYCFVHLPKCAGTHITRILVSHFEGRSIDGQMHAALDSIENGITYLASIRNPYSFYVSLWAAWSRMLDDETPRPFLQRMFGNRLHLMNNCLNVDNFRAWLPLVLNKEIDTAGSGLGRYGSCRLDVGLLTFRFRSMLSGGTLFEPATAELEVETENVIRAERLEDDLLRIMRNIGFSVTSEVEAEIRTRRHSNRSPHLPFREYYDGDTAKLIEKKESYLLEKFSYGLGGPQ